MRKFLLAEAGAIFTTLSAAGMTLGILIIIPVLASTSTSLRGLQLVAPSTVYSPDSVVEHAIWRLVHEPGYGDSFTSSSPVDEYDLTLNGVTSHVTITSSIPPPPDAEMSITKVVNPKIAPVDTLTTFTYTITIVNDDGVAHEITELRDKALEYFDYVTGSTSGFTTVDPSQSGKWLHWQFSPPYPQIPPNGGIAQLIFQVTASQPEGTYFNPDARIYILPPDLFKIANSAPVRFANEGNVDVGVTVDPTVARAGLETLFTYTFSMFNNDATTHDLDQILNVLPVGFSYVVGTTSGLTGNEPLVVVDPPTGRQELLWDFTSPYPIRSVPTRIHASPHFPSAEYAVNIGMSMRSAMVPPVWRTPEERILDVNLLPLHLRPEHKKEKRALAAASIALALGLVYPFYQMESGVSTQLNESSATLSIDERLLQARMVQIRKGETLVSAIEENQANLETLKQQARVLLNSDGQFAGIAQTLHTIGPPGISLQQIVDDGNTVALRGTAESFQEVMGYIEAIRNQPYFSQVTLGSVSRVGTDVSSVAQFTAVAQR